MVRVQVNGCIVMIEATVKVHHIGRERNPDPSIGIDQNTFQMEIEATDLNFEVTSWWGMTTQLNFFLIDTSRTSGKEASMVG